MMQGPRARYVRAVRLAVISIASMLALTACFAPKKPDPTPLEPLKPKVAGKQVWKHRVGKVEFPLTVAVNGSKFTLAADDGTVTALQADDGKELWSTDVGTKLSAGVGSDGRFASVVTRDNELVTLDNGKVTWRQRLPSRVTTAPLVAGERVFVLGVDRSVQAFDVLDGRKLWTFQRPSDALTLSKPGVIAAFKDTLLVGQGAKLSGLDPLKGTLRWEVTLASPRGTNEVERLADLLAPLTRVGEVVCARSFQSAVACVNAERGALLWTRNTGGVDGIGADDQMVVGADASDRLSAWRAADGTVAWTSEKFLYRDLSAPLGVGKTFVVGDLEGMVHWLARDDGEPVLRLPTDGSAIRVAPVNAGLTLLVVTRDGGAFAFRPE
jgi:outer membrane assembly lipoprotein YfgL